ncbi:MAG: Dabb family protein [Deinococcus sp.]|nr:Dabb family protein [Deinococcus sp.]
MKHVVLFKFKANATAAQRQAAIEGLHPLPQYVPEIRGWIVGEDVLHSERSYDIALLADFADLAALQRYQVHPKHQAAAKAIVAISEKVAVVDYEIG